MDLASAAGGSLRGIGGGAACGRSTTMGSFTVPSHSSSSAGRPDCRRACRDTCHVSLPSHSRTAGASSMCPDCSGGLMTMCRSCCDAGRLSLDRACEPWHDVISCGSKARQGPDSAQGLPQCQGSCWPDAGWCRAAAMPQQLPASSAAAAERLSHVYPSWVREGALAGWAGGPGTRCVGAKVHLSRLSRAQGPAESEGPPASAPALRLSALHT